MFERDDPLWRAASIVAATIRKSSGYAEAARIVVDATIAECRGRDVPAMRELGGFSAVLRKHVRALPDWAHTNLGSQMFPRSIADVLDVGALRERVQWALASEVRS